MPDYKKKSVKKVKLNAAVKPAKKAAPKKKKPVKVTKPEIINMERKPKKEVKTAVLPKKPVKHTPQKVKNNSSGTAKKNSTPVLSFTVISGEKAVGFFAKHKFFLTVIVLIIAIALFSLFTPTGLIEYSQNYFKSIGSGKFPKDLVGAKTLDCRSNGNPLILTDAAYLVYNESGKTVFSDTHGFTNPIMKTSKARTLVFDQNGNNYKVYNYSTTLTSGSSNDALITGDICRNGSYAIVSKPADYASKVEIFTKHNKMKFTWCSSKEIVTAVTLSNNGNRLAVATIYANAGQSVSKVYIFGYKSADPLYTLQYESPVLYLENFNGSSFVAATETSVNFIKWKNGVGTTAALGGRIISIREVSATKLCVSCESSNNNLETRLIMFNNKFFPEKDIVYAGAINDVLYYGKCFYCLDGNRVYKIDGTGKVIKHAECGYSVRRILPRTANSVITVSDSSIDKCVLED